MYEKYGIFGHRIEVNVFAELAKAVPIGPSHIYEIQCINRSAVVNCGTPKVPNQCINNR